VIRLYSQSFSQVSNWNPTLVTIFHGIATGEMSRKATFVALTRITDPSGGDLGFMQSLLQQVLTGWVG
jgi:hypothetical protein